MPDNMDNIIDTSKPSAGRIYDYALGGNHNFEIDRQVADHLMKIMPFFPKICRLQRWTLKDIAVELAERRGYDVIIDFASGLPTMDHIHLCVPPGTTVIYSDHDPIVVEYGREILKGVPNTYFFENDVRWPEELFARPEVQEILGGRRKVGIAVWGISVFLRDEEIRHLLKVLYDWAAPGSCLALNAQGVDMNMDSPITRELFKTYADMGTPGYVRTLEQFIGLCGDWKVDGEGFIPLLEWHGFDKSTLGDDDSWGPLGSGYGAYLIKQ